MTPLQIRLSDHVTLAVPPHLDSITTYVLLEQETWFEKELNFVSQWLKPGMTAIDVGANLGVYTLPMARMVGPQGRVFAYEPGSEARNLLEQSREINGASSLEIFPFALSDGEREGRLAWGSSSELNALGHTGKGETVHITSLDIENEKRGWVSPDFIKIDAEGEEERILAGGRLFFARHSPLVMFEIKAGAVTNELRAAFATLDYQLFRLLVGAPILVPLDPRAPLDPFELNLFAAKPDRVRSLCDEGFLVNQLSAWEPDSAALSTGLSLLREQPFATAFGRLLDDTGQIDSDYGKVLAAYAVWRTNDLPAQRRFAALLFAYQSLAALCKRAPTTARYSTFARLAWEGGWRNECVKTLRQMAALIQWNPFQPTEPVWPPNPRFDKIVPGDDPALWFATSIAEQLERAQSHSTYFSGVSPWLASLCKQPAVSHEMQRRRVLLQVLRGENPIVPSYLRQAAPDHLNADVWRTGMVPGTKCDE
jgi:FkbM family methyltransferase